MEEFERRSLNPRPVCDDRHDDGWLREVPYVCAWLACLCQRAGLFRVLGAGARGARGRVMERQDPGVAAVGVSEFDPGRTQEGTWVCLWGSDSAGSRVLPERESAV